MQEKPNRTNKINSTIPYAVNKIIMKAMEKDPNERYHKVLAGEMLKDLSIVLRTRRRFCIAKRLYKSIYTKNSYFGRTRIYKK